MKKIKKLISKMILKKALLLYLTKEGKCIYYHKTKFMEKFKSKIGYAFVFNSFKEFSDLGLVYLKKEGKERKVFLTEKGKEIQTLLKRIIKDLNAN